VFDISRRVSLSLFNALKFSTEGALMSVSIETLDTMIEKLEPEEQLAVVERIVNRLRKSKSRKARHWFELEGLGKEIWQGVDTKQYIRELRDEWERLPKE
jgi:hypothetical protein